ncbi:MAG: LamG-like jellyroll fold domain-containing protein [Phycisphaerae bacterium]|jgi:type II secretory pathway pseudopilin PulG
MPKISVIAQKICGYKMGHQNRKFHNCLASRQGLGFDQRLCCGGLTIVEMIIALAIMTIIFAAVLPQFRAISNGWDSKRANAELIQNGRILMDYISRNLSEAVQITAVSQSSDIEGYINFADYNGDVNRYDINTISDYVEFGPPGGLSDLAGPVSLLRFTCYDACDLNTPTTDVNVIRVVKVDATITNLDSPGRSKTFTTWVYLRTNANAGCGILGCWKLDETSGLIAADGSGSGNDGDLINMAGDEWTDGQINGALDFDGLNDYVDLGTGSSLNFGSSEPFTISAWVKTTENYGPIVSFRSSTDDGSVIDLMVGYDGSTTDSGKAMILVRQDGGGGGYARVTGAAVNDGQWHHVAATRGSGSTIELFVDGISQGTSSGAQSGGAITSDLIAIGSERRWVLVGYGTADQRYLAGTVDDVRIYSRALDADEIAELANVLKYVDFESAKTSSDVSLTILAPTTNEGDLLIAAVATDGDTSSSLDAPVGEGWTEINVEDYDNDVTLGVWWKLADASESASHQFSWTGARPAYGWIMHFIGHDDTNPINASSFGDDNDDSPASPAVTTTVGDCLILRIGAFDNGDIVVGDTGLLDHTTITMDKSSGILFEDGFETGFANWTTDWQRTTSQKHSGSYSAEAGRYDNDLISDNIDTSAYSSFTIEFWYRIYRIDDNDDVYLQLYDGSNYVNYFEVGNQPEDQWYQYQATITGAQYLRSNFRIKFGGSSIDQNEYLWIDDVVIGFGGVSGGAGYTRQSAIGSSGTSDFSLTSANKARMLTIAIAPAGGSDVCCGDQLQP